MVAGDRRSEAYSVSVVASSFPEKQNYSESIIKGYCSTVNHDCSTMLAHLLKETEPRQNEVFTPSESSPSNLCSNYIDPLNVLQLILFSGKILCLPLPLGLRS
jgi:hypothetical protein